MSVFATAINEVTSYANLYDKYKITAYKVSFIPRATEAEQGTIRNNILYTCLDYDDNNGPQNVQEILNFRNRKYTRGTACHTRYVRYPHTMAWVNQTTGQGMNAECQRFPWIDAAALNVPAFGIKWGVQSGGTEGVQIYIDVMVTAYVKWAGRR